MRWRSIQKTEIVSLEMLCLASLNCTRNKNTPLRGVFTSSKYHQAPLISFNNTFTIVVILGSAPLATAITSSTLVSLISSIGKHLLVTQGGREKQKTRQKDGRKPAGGEDRKRKSQKARKGVERITVREGKEGERVCKRERELGSGGEKGG